MTYRAGDKFTVSGDYAERGSVPVMATRVSESGGARGYWRVDGPRVLRGGRVDMRQRGSYGTVHDNGKINLWGGGLSSAAGRHHMTYLEIARDKLAGKAGGVGHVIRGPESAFAPEAPPPGTGGVLTVANKPYPRGETLQRLHAAGIAARVGRSPIAGTVLVHIDPQRGHEAWRIQQAVEREWLDAKHGRGGGKRRGGKRRAASGAALIKAAKALKAAWR